MTSTSVRAADSSRPATLLSPTRLRATLDGLCVPGVLTVVAQPIVRLADLSVVGYEALTRMPVRPHEPPDWWLEQAAQLGMRARLEIACWRAIAEFGPPPGDALLFVNVSPAALAEPDLLALRDELPERLVIEVTEQEAVADYMRLRADLVFWLGAKAHLAIDDTGAGHSSLRHVIELSPDFLKIDRSLVSSVNSDRNRRALLRSLVAFAREVGCTVIAEGVETRAELETLRDADVDLVQGYLFGRPTRPWTEPGTILLGRAQRARFGGVPDASDPEDARLRVRLGQAHDAHEACEAVADYLWRRGDLMPSIYLERQGQLRCVAQRGLWQVLDGLDANAGVTGRTWASGRPLVVSDVAGSSDYLEAIPGVAAEVCVPIYAEGRAVGALNVESLRPLSESVLPLLQDCARLLSDRLAVVGFGGHETSWQQAARASVRISGFALERDATEGLLVALAEAAGIDSAGLIESSGELAMRTAVGPLRSVLRQLPPDELVQLSSLVDHVSSCYTGSEATGRGFVGTASLRAYARAVVVLPLWSGGARLGTVVLAHSRPLALSGSNVEPLELLAGHLAATLTANSLVDQLRRQAREDRLTGLYNRAALEELLDAQGEAPRSPCAAVILDIDHFKTVNDRFGHLSGDEALRATAAHLADALGGVPVYRYGGDEFALLLEAGDAAPALGIAERLCATAATVLVPYGSSVTAGVAVSATGLSARELFGPADAALLWAKRHARGRAVAHADVAASLAATVEPPPPTVR